MTALGTPGAGKAMRENPPVEIRAELTFDRGWTGSALAAVAGEFEPSGEVCLHGASHGHLFEVLAKAEEVLGRKENPTLYAAEDFSQKLRSDDHFLTRAIKQPKIMLIGDDNDLPTGDSAESGEDRQAQG